MERTVKVRGRDGTSTKDISIPARVARDADIDPGDEFAVTTTRDEEDRLVIEYTRVERDE